MNRELIKMGALCQEAISLAAKALEEGSRGTEWKRTRRWHTGQQVAFRIDLTVDLGQSEIS